VEATGKDVLNVNSELNMIDQEVLNKMRLLFDIIVFLLILCCFQRIAELSNRLGMNIIVVQGLQDRVNELEKK
jgi:hypothetical protein